jgi:hypothetical protein
MTRGTRLAVFATLSLLVSCAGHLRIKPQKCLGEGSWFDGKESNGKDFEVTDKVWGLSFGQDVARDVDLKSFLEDHDVNCARVAEIAADIDVTWGDALISFFPFISRSTLTVRGNFVDEQIITPSGKMEDLPRME